MNTKIIMILSALFLGIIGIVLSFFPHEILQLLHIKLNAIILLFLQLLSAFYLGFGILNWMAKGTLLGGIYNRPLVLGNAMHFGVSTVAFIKAIPQIDVHLEIFITITVIYAILTLCFIYMFSATPKTVASNLKI